jgi:membrane protein DedA with SNARE-associated domain
MLDSIWMALQASVPLLPNLLSSSYSTILALIQQYGYLAIFLLMVLENAALPIPSEIILPMVGVLSAQGILNPWLGFLAATLGALCGLMIDYAIGYYLGKEVVYKHLGFFKVSRKRLDNLDLWFARNGAFAVFFARLVPEIRALVGFPAGFARMPLGKYILYSMLGCIIWDAVLIAFGYYIGQSVSSATVVLIGIAAFILIVYLVYRYYFRQKPPETSHKKGDMGQTG